LIHETKDANDDINNKTTEDVEVFFENDENVRQSGVDYTDEAWGYDDLIEVDEALKQLVDRTQNNTLLRTKHGNELTFLRVGSPLDPNSNVAGWSLEGSGKIWLNNLVFGEWNTGTSDTDFEASNHRESFDDHVHNIVLHEIGHKWSDENPDWGEWKNISGWHQWLGFGAWIHDDSDDIPWASDYAKESPEEDFAETFAAYFAFENGETFRSGDPSAVESPDELGEKYDHIDNWLDTID